jgi:enterochelin esterase family protein
VPPEDGLAIDALRSSGTPDAAAIDAFVASHEIPIVEGARCTFLHRGEAEEVHIAHRVVGLPDRIPLARIEGTDVWFAVVELPEGSRVEYRVQVTIEGRTDDFNDPLNPRLAHNPFGSSSVCAAVGYEVPDWTQHDDEARPGSLEELTFASDALGRQAEVTLYLPARFRRTARYPLLVVHDGADYLRFAAMKTVLDNLIHRLDVAGLVVAFTNPGDRMVEYAGHEGHAAFVVDELLPSLGERLPLVDQPRGRCLMGSSFGGVASLSTAALRPRTFGALIVQSGSFVFTDIGVDHGGGEVFDPVVEFMNRYRADPIRVADRIHASCGVYEPLITPNRAMVPTFRSTGAEVRWVEARDGHNWENWRDRLRDALAWVFPGPQKYVYE